MSPIELARSIGAPDPTPQQQAVISASLTEPHLVIAGAGSGKTATMANRVVWLVATQGIAPTEVLGLTFTRKAAGELDTRIAAQLDRYDESQEHRAAHPLERERPTVSTYNAFAASVYRDHALLIGYEPDATVISESVAWRLAHRIVTSSTDSRLFALDISVATVVDAVLSLAREIADHGADGLAVSTFARNLHDQVSPLVDSISAVTRRKKFTGYLANIAMLPLLVDLAAEYQAAKRARGYIEFSDQVSLAHRIITEHPSVAEAYRQRYRVVLLDEYQDTSVAQTRFLAELFRGCGVMAVGDPDQSIYGFRGASAANLTRFARDFGPGETFPLSVSWRNSTSVLAVANTVTQHIERTPGVTKPPLEPSPAAVAGEVKLEFPNSVLDEAQTVAEWFEECRSRAEKPPTMALLLRAKKHFAVFAEALRAKGIPFHIVGLSGLLAEPVIVDITCALAVISDSTANAELLRLLAGARWAIGPADIRALHELAKRIADHDDSGRLRDAEARMAARNSVEDIDTSSLVDALDRLAHDDIPRADWLDGFSPVGLERLRLAGAQFAAMRRRSHMRLADMIDLVITELQLDIEAMANPDAPLALNALEAFEDLVGDFLTLADDASIPAFLEWLDAAERRESLAPRQDEPEPGSVQIMTIHAAKGLEWEYVALPRLVVDEMPSKGQDVAGWLVRGRLPFPFRGDRDELPRLNWDAVDTVEELEDALDRYLEAVKHSQLQEEWRLGYVAVTRPKRDLLVSGSWWGGQQHPRGPGALLSVIAAHQFGEVDSAWPPAASDIPPSLSGDPQPWPLPPLGRREHVVQTAAEAVRSAGELTDPQLTRLIDLLIAEQSGERRDDEALPIRIPASRVKDYFADADAVVAEQRRPLPQKPYVATRLGTLFHSWVEHRGGGAIELDAEPSELDTGDSVQDERFAELRETFERSPWATLKPIDVEREIHLPLAGQVFICKIDAVYDVSGIDIGQAPGTRIQIVDWKTGAAPVDDADLERKQTQLALYRLAYATHLGIAPEDIDAVFYFVGDDRVVRPTRLLSEDEFVAAWSRLRG